MTNFAIQQIGHGELAARRYTKKAIREIRKVPTLHKALCYLGLISRESLSIRLARCVSLTMLCGHRP